jgi:phosphate-selective porin O/P
MSRRLLRCLPILALLACWAGPARAWTTLAEGDKGKLEFESRFMFWAVSAGQDDLPSGAPAPTPQTESIQDFLVRRIRLLFRAKASPSLQLYLQLGFDNLGSKILRDDAGLRIKDAYLTYRKFDALQVTVGQFKVPFFRAALETGFNQLLVDRVPLPGSRPAVEGTRDLGGMIWGNQGGFQYRAALFDGSDQEDTSSASTPRGAARVSYNWFTPEPDLGYSGTSIGEKRIAQIAIQADRQNNRVDGKDDAGFTTAPRDYRSWGPEFFLDVPFGGTWAATGEAAWIARSDDYIDPTLSDRAIRGYYAQAGLLLPGSIGDARMQVVGRFESYDIDRGTARTTDRNRSLGWNCYFKGHERKIQIDYTQKHERPVDLDNDELRLSVVAVF